MPQDTPAGLLEIAGQLLWPTFCPGCREPGNWCPQCRPHVAESGRIVVLDGDARHTAVAAASDYSGAMSAAIKEWKLGGRRGLLRPLGMLLADAVAHLLAPVGPVWLVPVPVRPASRRRRGEDLIARLADETSRQLPRCRTVPALQWRRNVAEQVGRGAAQRHGNLAGAMTARHVPGPVVVVDDVLTTGATMAEAVRALRAARVAAVAGVVLAASRSAAVPGADT